MDHNRSYNYNSIYSFKSQPEIPQDNANNSSSSSSNTLTNLLTYASYAGVALTFPISLPFCLKHVSSSETAVTSRAGGNLQEHQTPGYILSIPYLDTFEKFSKDVIRFAIQPLKAITRDLWELAIQGKAGYKINEPLKLVRATQEGREGLIKECTISTIKSICGRYNFNRIEDVGMLRNEVLLEVNRFSMQNWGIQLVTDEMSLKIDVIKRGEDGPGDPMVQIVKLVKEQFDNSGTQTQQNSYLQNIPGIEHIKNIQIPEENNNNLFPQYQLLQEISKYTALKAKHSFDKLDKTVFKIQLKDFPDFYFVVDGTDFEKPVKVESDDYKNCEINVTIGIKSSDIPKLLQHEYDALKVWLKGNIEITGTNDVNKAVSVGKFLRDLMS